MVTHRICVALCGLVLPLLGGCLAQDGGRPVGDRCSADGNCRTGLRCQYGRCRQPCLSDRECTPGAVCVPGVDDPTLYVCTLPDEGGGQGCPEGLVPAEAGTCRRSCDGADGPLEDDVCGPQQQCDQDLGWCTPRPAQDGGIPGPQDGGPQETGPDSAAVDSGPQETGPDGSPVDAGPVDAASDADSAPDGDAGTAQTDGNPDSSGGDGDAGAPTVPGTWVLIDVSGTPFTMGSPTAPVELGRYPSEVEHTVTLTRDFWMMTTEITQQQYLDEMGYNPSHFSSGGAGEDCGMNCPVERVSWHDVAAYTNALSALEGLGECYSCTGTAPDTIDCPPSGSYASPYDCPGYRLPTEAEWEYAARGGTATATYEGELTAKDCTDTTLGPIAWFCGNASSTTHPVADKDANAYGLYDMLGNVWEWCHDWYATYPGGAETDPTGPPSGSSRVLRGGSWTGSARDARAAKRNGYSPGSRESHQYGGRAVRSVP